MEASVRSDTDMKRPPRHRARTALQPAAGVQNKGRPLARELTVARAAGLSLIVDRLEASEETLRTLLDGVYDGVVLLDADGAILEANARALEMYGVTKGEAAQGTLAHEFSGPGNPPAALQSFWQKALQGETQVFEWKARRPHDGAAFDVELCLNRAVIQGRTMIVATVRDISRRKQLELDLIQAQRMEMVSTVVGGIAHDFNNILNNVLGFAYLLKKYANDRERSLKYSDVIERSVRRGTELADRLLSLAVTETTEHVPVFASEIIDEALARFAERFPAGVTVRRSVPVGLPPILGDREALVQALTHLLVNAGEAMEGFCAPGQAVLSVETRLTRSGDAALPAAVRDRSTVEIDVHDTGRGIPLNIRDRLFEPFVSTKATGQAAGLGLAVVYSIVRHHGGTITAESRPAEGTTLRVWLPEAGGAAREAPAAQAAKPSARGGETILLVDDEEAMRHFGQDILEGQGYRVLTASDGVEALAIYRDRFREIDLVILDLLMPRLDGGQTYLEMKRISKSVRAFFCTGFTADQVITSLLREHGLKALKKPLEIETFLSTVRDVLDAP
jgi:PAS domain S-box-containing protein